MPFIPPPSGVLGTLSLSGTVGSLAGAFPALSVVHGDLSVNGTDAASLGGTTFPVLETIGGQLNIEANVSMTTMQGAFPSLTSVQEHLKVNNSGLGPSYPLTNMTGAFAALTEIGDYLEFYGMDLTVFPAFSALQFIGRDDGDPSGSGAGGGLYLNDVYGSCTLAGAFPNLEQVSSSLGQEGIGIYSSPGFTSLAGAFPAVLGAQWFEVQQNINCTSMANFAAACKLYPQEYGYFEIYDNLVMTTMAGAFAATETSDYVEVYNNPLLTSIQGAWANIVTSTDYNYVEFFGNGPVDFTGAFASLISTNYIEIYGEGVDGVGNLDGAFPALKHVDYHEIYDCLGLTSMTGAFPVLTDVAFYNADVYPYGNAPSRIDGYIEFYTNPVLPNVNGSFASLDRLSYIEFNGNAGLTAIGGFAALTSVFSGSGSQGDLRIINNDALTNITSLAALTTVRYRLLIQGNAAVADISTLLNVNGANFAGSGFRQILIDNNPSLPTTAQAQALIDDLVGEGFGGTTSNTGNGPG